MKIMSKIRIHPLFYLSAFICIISGLFKDFYYITLIIIIHELGHIITSIYYKWKIEKIVILPFGGITIFNEYINRPIKEELLIAISGPLVQMLIFSLSSNLKILHYHYFLLFFNLLPIIPLDGSKIFNLILNKVFSFKKSYQYTIIVSILSILSILLLFLNKLSLIWIIVISFLIFKIVLEIKNYKYLINRFLFERYLYNFKFKKNCIINGLDVFEIKRDYKHLFLNKKHYYTEREILRQMFDKKI